MTKAPIADRSAHRSHRTSSDFFCVDEVALIGAGFCGSPGAAERLRLLSMQSAWGRAVGAQLRAVALPCSYRSGRLVVEVRDAAWKREMDRLKPEILSRLARLIPSHPIHDLCFRVRSSSAIQAVAAAEPLRLDSGVSGPERTAESGLGRMASLDRVTDEGLRDRLRQVMGRYLAGSR